MTSATLSQASTAPAPLSFDAPPRAAARAALLWMGAVVGLPLLLAWAQGAHGQPPPAAQVEAAR